MGLFDASQFQGNLGAFARGMPGAIQRGLAEAGATLLDDSRTLTPTPPKRTGRLRESGSVIVGRLVPATTQGTEGASEPGTPCTDAMPEKVAGRWACFVGYNTRYAAKVHNTAFNFREPGSGTGFLQRKMIERRSLYLGVLNEVVKREMGTG